MVLLIISFGCAPVTATTEPSAPTDGPAPTASPTLTATPPPTITHTPTPTATGSEGAPPAVAAGRLIPHTSAASIHPQLARDADDHLSLFFVSPDPSGGGVYLHSQLQADGAWSQPAAASPSFQFLDNLTLVPDMSGRLCIFWSGEQYDAGGHAVYGLWHNCQQADGAWQAQAQQPAVTSQPTIFSPQRGPRGALLTVLIAPAGRVEGLYFSAIASSAAAALTGTLLSGSQQVLFGRLAIDSNNGYHAAWVEAAGNGTAFTVQARGSSDEGKTWTPAEQLYAGTADNPAEITFRMLADSTGQVHLAWDGDNAVHYRRWNAADGWGDPVTLSGPDRSANVALAVNSDGLARAAWITSGTLDSVLLRRQLINGTWGATEVVTATPAFDLSLAVDAAGANRLVWRADDGLRYVAIP